MICIIEAAARRRRRKRASRIWRRRAIRLAEMNSKTTRPSELCVCLYRRRFQSRSAKCSRSRWWTSPGVLRVRVRYVSSIWGRYDRCIAHRLHVRSFGGDPACVQRLRSAPHPGVRPTQAKSLAVQRFVNVRVAPSSRRGPRRSQPVDVGRSGWAAR